MKAFFKSFVIACAILPTAMMANVANAFPAFEILQFYASAQQRGAIVIWKIQHDMDLGLYVLEYSNDQLSWEAIEEFEPEAGSDIEARDYYHAPLSDGTYFYRLIIRTSQGQEIVSKAIAFHLNASVGGYDGPVTTYSRPGVVNGNVQDLPKDGEIEVRDARGKIILTRPNALGVEKEIQAMPAGTYYIRYTESGLIRKIDTL